MIWIALVIGSFLFYQFVSRKHKILLFKILGGLSVILGVIAGSMSLYYEWKNEQKKSWKSVKFLYLNENSSGKKDLAIEICNKRKDSDLLKYEIDVAGYENGRSTGMKLFKQYDFEDWKGSSDFKSDLIVKRDSCKTVVWTGDFRAYDTYEAKSSTFYDKWAD